MPLGCPSCENDKISCIGVIPSTNVFAGRILSEPLDGGKLFRCLSCHLHFRFPRMPKSKLDELYRLGEENNWANQPVDRKDWHIAGNWIASNYERGSVLDVGCFAGKFLEFLGPDFKRFGIEIHSGAAKKAEQKGVQILGEDYISLETFSDTFDVVVAMDVIEHVPDPYFFLKLLVGVLRPGGSIIISTGNTQATSWQWMGSRYWYCTIAEHISFINPAWCYHVAQKINLKVDRIWFFSHATQTLQQRLIDFGKNTIYLAAPGLMQWMRKRGVGRLDATKHIELFDHPPAWLSAKDHLITFFKRPL